MKNFDDSEFKRKMAELRNKLVPANLKRAVHAGAVVLHNLAQNEVPKPPLLTGALRNSSGIHVNGVLVLDNNLAGYAKVYSAPAQVSPPPDPEKNPEALVSFNAPYSMRWHETPANWSAVDVGNKYLQIKMLGGEKEIREAMAQQLVDWSKS